jgi:hypothetical protein
LTGALIGGYARDEGFEWGGHMAFTRRYGRIETTHRIVTTIDTGEVVETTDTHWAWPTMSQPRWR